MVDEQVAYMVSNILSDASARTLFGSQATGYGFVVPGVWTASKTGTTTTADDSVAKDSLMVSYSTAVATVVWNGNHDGSGVRNNTNNIVRRMIANYMERVHKEVYANTPSSSNPYALQGKWKSGDQPARPAGIQTLSVNGTTDIWPSWYNSKTSGVSKEKLEFNKYTKKLASNVLLSQIKSQLKSRKL